MRALRLLLVVALPALAAALEGCTAEGSGVDDQPLIAREARPIPDGVPFADPEVLDAAAPIDGDAIVPWNPSDAVPDGPWVDISWIAGDPRCGEQVEGARGQETGDRVVVDLQRGERRPAAGGATCGDAGFPMVARIPLTEPVGSRELLQHRPTEG